MTHCKNPVFDPVFSEKINIALNIDDPKCLGELLSEITIKKIKDTLIRNDFE